MKFQARAAAVLAVMIVSVSLGGCLVEKDKTPKKTYQRATDNLRVYQNGDYINYNVQITQFPAGGGTAQTQSATLKIQWLSNPNLTNPLSSTTSYPVLREVTTLTDSGGGTLFGGVRYIQQDASGAVSLVAIEDSGGGGFWFNTQGDSDLSVVGPMTVFDSPLSTGPSLSSPINFHIIEGCSSFVNHIVQPAPPCEQSIAQFNDYIEVLGDTHSVTTNIGVFTNPLEIQFDGSMTTNGGIAAPPVDFRHACRGGVEFSTTHDTRAYVFPEIGVIGMTNTCRIDDTGYYAIYSVTLSNTNIPLPQ